jgi:glutaredoxin
VNCAGPMSSRTNGVDARREISRLPGVWAVYNRNMHKVLVYSRKGCHLCDVVKETLIRVEGEANFQWHEVDIDADPELLLKYNDEVPVVFIDGRKAFKYHMDGADFLRALTRETNRNKSAPSNRQ